MSSRFWLSLFWLRILSTTLRISCAALRILCSTLLAPPLSAFLRLSPPFSHRKIGRDEPPSSGHRAPSGIHQPELLQDLQILAQRPRGRWC
jgi:hypothetical protein